MKIGINAANSPEGGGLTSLRQLLEEWGRSGILGEDELIAFASTGAYERIRDVLPARTRVVPVAGADKGPAGRLIAEQFILAKLLREHGIDVLFCPGNTMPLNTRVPCVTIFQNAAPFCEVRNATMALRLRWLVLGALIRQAASRAQTLIFLSRFFLDLFVRKYGFDPSRGVLIYRSGFLAGAHRVQRRNEILSVSHFYPYKNLIELIEGFLLARRQRRERWQLLLVGGDLRGDYGDRVRARLRALNASDEEIRVIGILSPKEISELLKRCGIFAFSSVCENCPTALIEALRAGAPIACSNVGVMPEIAADAADYFDPYAPTDIARVLGDLMDQPERRALLSEKAEKRGTTFPDPASAAAKTLEVIRAAASG